MAPLDSRQVETMYFDVVGPVFYIYSIFPRKVRYSWGLKTCCREDDLQ